MNAMTTDHPLGEINHCMAKYTKQKLHKLTGIIKCRMRQEQKSEREKASELSQIPLSVVAAAAVMNHNG